MSNEYKDWIEDLKRSNDPEDHKSWLIHEYPWLNLDEDEAINYLDIEKDKIYTFIDCAPPGWAKPCEDLCAELKVLFDRIGFTNEYRLCQVKEKYGKLRWYDISGVPDEIWNEYNAIIRKYEELSAKTCCICGAPATKISTGWISPFCDKCAEEINGTFKEIKE